jgi:glucokinase
VGKINPSALALGVDIGATSIKAAIVNTNGELLQQLQAPSPRSVDALSEFVQSAAKLAKLPLTGVGIGCKGIIDHTNSRVDRLPGDLHFLEGRYLSEVIGGGLPVSADNDARTALIAEVLWGAARGKRNIVLLTLGTGVGGAVMVDGIILHGATGIAGHFGHITVELNGGLCMCGNHGCLETVFSSRAIEADYFSHIHRAAPAKLSMSDGKVPNAKAIFEAAFDGDECARRVVDRALDYLAASVVSLFHIFDPEMLIIGGNMAAADDQLLKPLKCIVAHRSRRMMGREVPIVPQSSIGYGGVLGAAGLIFLHQQLLKI